jgi:crotonobetainyl-CoA:carnitine CoA-transferase CaiB-like acyl-CoA transferase
MQAMSGIMDVQGDNGATDKQGGFAYVKTLMCDKITAYTAAQAITAALFARERTGNGAHLDLSMLASCIAFLWPDGGMHLTLLDDDVVHGVPFSDYYQAPLPATDGAVAYAAMSDDHWAAIFDVVGRPDLKAVEKYQGLANRSVHIAELAQIVTAETPKYNSAELLKQLRKADVPAAPCLTIDALQSEDQIIAIEAFEMQDHPILGMVQNVAAPVFFNGQQLPASGPSPTLGQHSAEILDALNLG